MACNRLGFDAVNPEVFVGCRGAGDSQMAGERPG